MSVEKNMWDMNFESIKLCSRGSPLALWQTQKVADHLQQLRYNTQVLIVESMGDLRLTLPIYTLGISGVFTKELDTHILNNHSDLAVHSLKDVPTNLAEGLVLAGVLERGSPFDILLYKNKEKIFSPTAHISSGSLRRQSQWLSKYPNHQFQHIRGNIQTRIKKFQEEENVDGMILAQAGLERMNLIFENSIVLNDMIPAPAQGIIGIICRKDNAHMIELCHKINHMPTFICATVERDFMNTLHGGCSVPIACRAQVYQDKIHFMGAIYSFDGSRFFRVEQTYWLNQYEHFGKNMAKKILNQKGAEDLLNEIKNVQ